MKYGILLVCLTTILVGCSPSVRVIRYNNKVYTTTTAVDVFRTKPPDRRYDEIGELEVKSKYDDAVELLVEKAKEIGADAIILMGDRQSGALAVPIGELVYAKSIMKLWAVAIKYKE